jgi:hypothetical protein
MTDLLGRPPSSNEVTYLVLVDDNLQAFLDMPDMPERAMNVPLSEGDELIYLVLNPGEQFFIDADSFGLRNE